MSIFNFIPHRTAAAALVQHEIGDGAGVVVLQWDTSKGGLVLIDFKDIAGQFASNKVITPSMVCVTPAYRGVRRIGGALYELTHPRQRHYEH